MTASPSTLRRRLLTWYDAHRRDLPWRKSRDPYAILVSEVMLQQTRVETVIPYFLRFLTSFPSVEQLAAATEEDVLRHWAGLGYYRRARLLHSTAKAVVERHRSRFPDTVTELLALPGIGRYTAGALASIAFDKSEPLVDGNVARVIARVSTLPGDTKQRAFVDRAWQIAAEWVPATRAGDFNQALMELGATVCTPRDPRCSECPIAMECAAKRSERVAEFPTPTSRSQPIAVRIASCIVESDSSPGKPRIAIVRRTPGTKMAGLHDLPALEISESEDAGEALVRYLEDELALEVSTPRRIGAVRHTITKHRIVVEVHRARLLREKRRGTRIAERVTPRSDLAPIPDSEGVHFIERFALDGLGWSGLAKKQLRLLEKQDAASRDAHPRGP